MKLWVDDERRPVDDWLWVKTPMEAIRWLESLPNTEMPDEVSLDHDMGSGTGMEVLEWMITWNRWPKALTIHTSNPPARKRMLAAANAEAPDWVDINIIYW